MQPLKYTICCNCLRATAFSNQRPIHVCRQMQTHHGQYTMAPCCCLLKSLRLSLLLTPPNKHNGEFMLQQTHHGKYMLRPLAAASSRSSLLPTPPSNQRVGSATCTQMRTPLTACLVSLPCSRSVVHAQVDVTMCLVSVSCSRPVEHAQVEMTACLVLPSCSRPVEHAQVNVTACLVSISCSISGTRASDRVCICSRTLCSACFV
eukprot:1157926-Pelagomonas_calceolata.AAC.3